MRVQCNFNDKVRIRLTPKGEEMQRKFYEALNLNPDLYKKTMLPGGWMEYQLHEVMHIFGPAMYNGSSPPVEMVFWMGDGAP